MQLTKLGLALLLLAALVLAARLATAHFSPPIQNAPTPASSVNPGA